MQIFKKKDGDLSNGRSLPKVERHNLPINNMVKRVAVGGINS